MNKGISIWSFGAAPLEEAFQVAKKAGIEGVEVALDLDGELTGLSAGPTQWKKIRDLADANGLKLYSVASGLYWDFRFTSSDPQEREKAMAITRHQLEMAAFLGCDTILVIPGAVSVDFLAEGEIVDYTDAYQRAGEAVSILAEDAKRTGVSIGLENVWNKFLVSPLEMARFLDEVGSPWVGAYFDVGNALYNGYPEHWIRALGSRIKKVHWKDYRCAAGGLHGFVDLLAGDVNWPGVMKSLEDVGYCSWVTAEMIPQYAHYTDQIIYNTSQSMDRILAGK
jgi:L-ribulose-5-phosphate 3-epimerase